jgi:hypothetical protein
VNEKYGDEERVWKAKRSEDEEWFVWGQVLNWIGIR